MIICDKCFVDTEIIKRITSHKAIGVCPTCHHNSTYLYNTDTDDYLDGIFNDIIDLYDIFDEHCKMATFSQPKNIEDIFIQDWNIFSELKKDEILNIIKCLSKDSYYDNPQLFKKPLILKKQISSSESHENSILNLGTWNNFVESLKHKNRFYSSYLNTKILEPFFSYIRKSYQKGELFYRARICDKNGLSKFQISAPPTEYTTDGRANSKGISRL